MAVKWPVFYNEDHSIAKCRLLFNNWATDYVKKGVSLETIARRHYLPVETVIHAMSSVLIEFGNPEKAMKLLEGYQCVKEDQILFSVYFRCLMAAPGVTLEQYEAACFHWQEAFGSLPVDRREGNYSHLKKDPQKRLSVGFLCSYLSSKPLNYALQPFFKAIDRKELHVVLLSTGQPVFDDFGGDVVCNFLINQPDAVCQAIHDANIDILIDMDGRFRTDNSIDVILRKLAPIQVNWFNMVASYNLRQIDWIFTDIYDLPFGAEHCYQEQIYRFRHGVSGTFDIPNEPIMPLPALTKEVFTFGSMGALFKINDEVLEVWGKILARLPKARLFLKFFMSEIPYVISRINRVFREYNLKSGQIVLETHSPIEEAIKRYDEIDLCLNTFPYTGGTSAIYALWKGVPTLTYRSRGMLFGGGAGIFEEVGLGDFVVDSQEAYIERAVQLTEELSYLSEIRQTMRSRLKQSARFDPPRFARDFEEACRFVWQDWLKKEANL